MARTKKKPPPPEIDAETPPADESTTATAAADSPAAESLPETEGETAAEGEPTLEELTAIEKARLEQQLADEMEDLDEDVKALKEARQAHKDAKSDVESRRAEILKTNQALREVIRGRWRPVKPDPQRELDFPEDLDEPESEAVWRSKPISELGLPKTIVTKLENENLTTLGAIVAAQESPVGFEGLDFSEKQLSKIQSAVHKHRPAPPVAPEGESEAGDESDEETEE